MGDFPGENECLREGKMAAWEENEDIRFSLLRATIALPLFSGFLMIPAMSTNFCHRIPVNDPFVKMSANCSLVPMNLRNILGSTMSLSNNQSKSTLKVRAIWRMFKLRPFLPILITASLSSNRNSLHLPLDRGKVHGT